MLHLFVAMGFPVRSWIRENPTRGFKETLLLDSSRPVIFGLTASSNTHIDVSTDQYRMGGVVD